LPADRGVVPVEACAFVESSGSCLVAVPPGWPVGDVAEWLWVVECGGEELLDLLEVNGISPRSEGSGW
jgi:hypothetical protein